MLPLTALLSGTIHAPNICNGVSLSLSFSLSVTEADNADADRSSSTQSALVILPSRLRRVRLLFLSQHADWCRCSGGALCLPRVDGVFIRLLER